MKKYTYDIFLSHNNADKQWTEKLAFDIENNADRPLKTFFDKWDIEPGGSIPLELEKGLNSSRYIGLIMSSEAFQSPWVALELATALNKGIELKKKTIIPILRRKCEIPLLLKGIKYIDFSLDENYQDSLSELLCVLLDKELPRGRKIPIEQYNENWDKDILSDYVTLFQRPAFSYPCIDELSIAELSEAIDDIMAAINTGRLYSRSGKLLKEITPRENFKTDKYRNGLNRIVRSLSKTKYYIATLFSIFQNEMDMSGYGFNCSIRRQIMICDLDCIKNINKRKECIKLMDSIDMTRNDILENMNMLLRKDMFQLIEISSKLIDTDDYLRSRIFERFK